MSLHTPLPCTQSIKTPPSPPTPYRSPLQAPRTLEPIPEREQHCPLERHWSQMESWWKEAPAEEEQKRRSFWRRGRTAEHEQHLEQELQQLAVEPAIVPERCRQRRCVAEGPPMPQGGLEDVGLELGRGQHVDAGRRA
ncbi:hypothetical protein EVG20_g10803 [Dentipellis fragilis]|uniref:Uncharacterized protein n=1 Tax=Dentipellis fragilis TaxID=205917 RepID=A0A4Y9XTJ0_9AGAM|nr:hypothetical protein EVG20_g10803 [Dentipellis fragilis]